MGRSAKDYSDRELTQGRAFQCILYPDSEEYDCNLLLNRLDSFWDKAWFVLHDSDSYTESEVEEWKLKNPNQLCPFVQGELKKAHYHVIGYRESPLILGLAAQKFGVSSNHVQKVKNVKSAVRYLIHKDNPDKHQYDVDKIHLVKVDEKELSKYLRLDVDMLDKGKRLFDFIQTHERVTLTQLTTFAFENECYDELRRGQHLYTALLIERNGRYDY